MDCNSRRFVVSLLDMKSHILVGSGVPIQINECTENSGRAVGEKIAECFCGHLSGTPEELRDFLHGVFCGVSAGFAVAPHRSRFDEALEVVEDHGVYSTEIPAEEVAGERLSVFPSSMGVPVELPGGFTIMSEGPDDPRPKWLRDIGSSVREPPIGFQQSVGPGFRIRCVEKSGGQLIGCMGEGDIPCLFRGAKVGCDCHIECNGHKRSDTTGICFVLERE